MWSVVFLSVFYAEHRNSVHCAECQYAECLYAEYRGAMYYPMAVKSVKKFCSIGPRLD